MSNKLTYSIVSLILLLALSACGGGSDTQNAGNSAPIANAGLDQNIVTTSVVDLNGSLSSDANNDTLTYTWSITSQPTTGTATLSNLVAVNPYFTADLDGSYIISLVVNNGTVSSVADTVTIVATTSIFTSGDTWKSITYGTVTSPFTGKIWLDRNLGASQVCTALKDIACYGDYYQWGRAADGHENNTSATTSTLATTITAVDGSFITSGLTYDYDWAQSADLNGALRSAEWSKTDGTSICPVGYRVPTMTEIEEETTSASTVVTNYVDAFDNFLKLPSTGSRGASNGSVDGQAPYGYIWSSSVSNTLSRHLFLNSSYAYATSVGRGYGFPVRCIKD